VTAFGHEHALLVHGEVGDERQLIGSALLLEDERPDGYVDLEVGGRVTGLVGTLPVLTVLGFEFGMEPEVDERVLGGRRDDVDRAAVAAVATIGTATRNELLTAKTQASASTVAGDHVDVYFIDEHRPQYRRGMKGDGRSARLAEGYSPGMTLMRRPWWP
jgi:hypothetical protein